MADELSVEDILAIEHDVIPLDGADVFQQGEIDSIGDRVALIENLGVFPRLPVDDARQDQVQAFRQVQAERSARPDRARLPRRLGPKSAAWPMAAAASTRQAILFWLRV
jgi:hypothetical protein